MIHRMRLHNKPFELIKNKSKTIEMRLFDEKRRLIKKGDIIEFENRTTLEIIKTKVIKLYKYKTFDELYKHFNKKELGYLRNETINVKDIEKYYSKEEQNKYGALAIRVELIEEAI